MTKLLVSWQQNFFLFSFRHFLSQAIVAVVVKGRFSNSSFNYSGFFNFQPKMFSRFQQPLALAARQFSSTPAANRRVAVMGASGGN
jgi:hypothetical protein